jgi:4-alpha-glucanotransferase
VSKRTTRPAGLQTRSAGILLHPTSLPSPYGVGDLGPTAYRFADFLQKAGQRWWQMLPIGPTGVGHSPYQPFSAFAGNPLLISPELLREEGLLQGEEGKDIPAFSANRVEYDRVAAYKHQVFDIAFHRFRGSLKGNKEFIAFEQANAHWLNDYALFASLQRAHKLHAWTDWQGPLRRREKPVMDQVRKDLHDGWLYQKFLQFEFARQWKKLKAYCSERGIGLLGDLPIYVALDSADVWAHPDYYRLDSDGKPKVVAGVPPDLFSKTGQRWGNPLYQWSRLKEQKYLWWVQRFQKLFGMFDVVRLDHFIGFHRYWEIPVEEETAVKGKFAMGPGADFFKEILKKIPQAIFIAEDLGVVIDEVTALREQFQFPGMNVLQFAFGGEPAKNPYLPHKYIANSVVYTGTHDNDTAAGWFASASESEKKFFKDYAGPTSGSIEWDLIRLAYASVSNTAILPMQDCLGLGSEARMNYPGKLEGNWQWRMGTDAMSSDLASTLHHLTHTYSRQQQRT